MEAFLTHLAVEGKVSASTENQALFSLLFLYKEALSIDLSWLNNVVRAKQPQRLSNVLTRTALVCWICIGLRGAVMLPLMPHLYVFADSHFLQKHPKFIIRHGLMFIRNPAHCFAALYAGLKNSASIRLEKLPSRLISSANAELKRFFDVLLVS
ncbi:phage integrase N-terminal SAM-like domain-containing protein [Methylobacter sp. Wu1]|uniref:phage integrase N-terminal SAM-like domain-containing protein n=1 Tax=Methylobacter sp. Wu1 TaxID=3119359 RepID=UPI002F94FE6F